MLTLNRARIGFWVGISHFVLVAFFFTEGRCYAVPQEGLNAKGAGNPTTTLESTQEEDKEETDAEIQNKLKGILGIVSTWLEYNPVSCMLIGLDSMCRGEITKRSQIVDFRDELFGRDKTLGSNEKLSLLNLSEFPKKVINVFKEITPRYLIRSLTHSDVSNGEFLKLVTELDATIKRAYDLKLPLEERNQAKKETMIKVLDICGPHAQKMFQMFRSKDRSDWLSEAILQSRIQLRPQTRAEAEKTLRDSLTREYGPGKADEFFSHITLGKSLGVGTIGEAIEAVYKATPDSPPIPVVLKFPKPGVKERLMKDKRLFGEIFESLVAERLISEEEAKTFSDMNANIFKTELAEIDTSTENKNLKIMKERQVYSGKLVDCVSIPEQITNDFGKALVIMTMAPGEALGKRQEALRLKLKSLTISSDERSAITDELSAMRDAFVEFAKLNIRNVVTNNYTHGDPHSGNFNWNYNSNSKKGKLTVLDLGAVIEPASSPENHKQLLQFLFHLNLAAGTGDAEYLRIYYKTYVHKNGVDRKVDETELNELLSRAKTTLDKIKQESQDSGRNLVDSDEILKNLVKVFLAVSLDSKNIHGLDLLPDAVLRFARTNTLVSEQLVTLMQDLKDADPQKYTDSSFLSRTHIAVTATGIFENRIFEAIKELAPWNNHYWTAESWKYFLKNNWTLTTLAYESKFAGGVLGLTKEEADTTITIAKRAITKKCGNRRKVA